VSGIQSPRWHSGGSKPLRLSAPRSEPRIANRRAIERPTAADTGAALRRVRKANPDDRQRLESDLSAGLRALDEATSR
jgi:hypothetical protein